MLLVAREFVEGEMVERAKHNGAQVLLRFLVFKETENLYRRTVMGDLTGTARLPMGAQMCCGALAGFVETAMVVQPFERGKTLRADFHSPYQVRLERSIPKYSLVEVECARVRGGEVVCVRV